MGDILRKCRAKLYSSVNEFREDKNALNSSTPTPKKPVRIKLSLKKGKNKNGAQDDGRDGNKKDIAKRKSGSQSELSKVDDSSDESEFMTEENSGIVGMHEREVSFSKRSKIRSGGLGSR